MFTGTGVRRTLLQEATVDSRNGCEDILSWLKEENTDRLEILWKKADATRRQYVGDEVHLRGLVEISNTCVHQCAYCGLRAGNTALERYRMTADEVMECVREAQRLGYGTVVLQGGEDRQLSTRWVESLVRRIRNETILTVTLSLGERSESELRSWRRAGADRYFLRFETSDAQLFDRIHPSLPGRRSDRPAILCVLKDLGYEIGSGVMVGIPGQTYESLAGDILLFHRLDLDMIGVGPFLPHPATPLGSAGWISGIPASEQVPNSEIMVCKVLALSRVYCPEANIPSTTALATLNKSKGFELGLERGANVIMPNLTPLRYRRMYEIYPDKACYSQTLSSPEAIHERIRSMGRIIGKGPGGRRRRHGENCSPKVSIR